MSPYGLISGASQPESDVHLTVIMWSQHALEAHSSLDVGCGIGRSKLVSVTLTFFALSSLSVLTVSWRCLTPFSVRASIVETSDLAADAIVTS